jgi:hypothetical protein
MIEALIVLAALLGLLALAFSFIRLERVRRDRNEVMQWTEMAALLDAELEARSDGRLCIRDRAQDLTWELEAGAGGQIRFLVSFDGADRLAPATLWRSSHEGDESSSQSTDFRFVFAVDESPVPAGRVRWLADPIIRDLLVAIHPNAVRVTEVGVRPVLAIEIVMGDTTSFTVRAAIDWALRMAHLAREGSPAAPPH